MLYKEYLDKKVELRWFKNYDGELVVERKRTEKTWFGVKESWWEIATARYPIEGKTQEDVVFERLKRWIDDLNNDRAREKFVPEYNYFNEEDVSKGAVKLFRNWKSK